MIGVVGAGMSGLTVGRELATAGVAYRVFEASSRVGGVVRSERVEGRVLDFGPQRIRLTPVMKALIEELGLSDALITAPDDLPLYVYRDARLRRVPFSVAELLSTDLLSARGKARFLLEPLVRARGRLGRHRPHGRRGHPGRRNAADLTAAEFFTFRFGREAYRNLFGPLFGGIYGSDPADMLARHSLEPALRRLGVRGSLVLSLLRRRRGRIEPPPACNFREGMQMLTDALYEGQRENVALDSPVKRIRRSVEGYQLLVNGREVEVEQLVLAVPAAVAVRLLEEVDRDASQRLRRLRYNELAVVHLRADHVNRPGHGGHGGHSGHSGHGDVVLRGLGYQVALGEELATRGVTWNDSLFGGRRASRESGGDDGENDGDSGIRDASSEGGGSREGVYTAFLGGADAEEVLNLADDPLGEIAATEFERVTGRPARVLSVRRVAMPAWDATWVALDGFSLPGGIHVCASWYTRPGLPGRLRDAGSVAEAVKREGNEQEV